MEIGEPEAAETVRPNYDNGEGGALAEVKKLKPWTILFLALLPTILILIWSWHWQFFIVTLLLFLPTARLGAWWLANRHVCPLDHVLSSYAQGFVGLTICAMGPGIVAFFIVLVTSIPFFSLIAAFAAWVFVEEIMCVMFTRLSKRLRRHRVGAAGTATKAWAIFSTASSVGFATAQIILAMMIVFLIDASDHKISNGETGWLFMMVLIFAFFWMPMRIITSYLVGLELTLSDDASHPCDGYCEAWAFWSGAAFSAGLVATPAAGDAAGDGAAPAAPASLVGKARRGVLTITVLPVIARTWFMTMFFFVFNIVIFTLAPSIGIGGALVIAVLLTTLSALPTLWLMRRRVLALEGSMTFDPYVRDSANLRAMYGFSLLGDGDDDGRTELMAGGASSSSQVQTFPVSVPEGAKPGASLQVTAPNGVQLQVVIPGDVAPGTSFPVVVPEQQAAAVPAYSIE